MPQFWTFGNIWPGFQSQGVSSHVHDEFTPEQNSWQPAWQSRPLPTYFFRQWWESNICTECAADWRSNWLSWRIENFINFWNDPFPPKHRMRQLYSNISHQMELHLVLQKMAIIISAPVEDPCMPGYQPVGESCTKCPFGFYKSTIGNIPCSLCPEFSSTLILGATLPSQCGKKISTFDHMKLCFTK